MINVEVEKLQELYDEKSKKYHDDTKFGLNSEQQSSYDLLFSQLRT